MPYKDPEIRKAYEKEWRENNKAYFKQYHKNNKEHMSKQQKEYRHTEEGLMFCKILDWERQGVIYYDMKELYYIVKMTKHCHYCWCLLVEGQYGSNRKCLDHNHETGEPRGVICHTCNIKDVFKNC